MDNNRRTRIYLMAALVLTGATFVVSLLVGSYPIVWSELYMDGMSQRVFLTLRLPRTLMALVAGLALGIAGSVYQAVFQNPLAAPDIIGVSSGASVGAAAAILAFGSSVAITALCAFTGGFIAVLITLALATASRKRGIASIVLSGIAVNALAQALLMLLKLTADPEKELASIEFWTMGSFAGITMEKFIGVIPWVLIGLAGIMLLHRQVLLLGLDEDDAHMLGVPVKRMRRIVLLLATLITGAVVSVTGLISFVGLLAPHIARLLTRNSRFSTTILSGLAGGCLMLLSDVLARSIGSAGVPVSIVTSLLGAPFLIYLMCKKEGMHG